MSVTFLTNEDRKEMEERSVLTTPQTLTDEQRAQARANIGAIEEDVLAVKEFPKNFEGLYGTMGCNIFELEQGNYVDNSNSSGTLYAVADDGTFKILGIANYNDVVYILRYPASIHVVQKNMTIAVSLADVSTADNIAVTYSYNKNYIETSNTRAYTPTSDYHPATKKYVDDTAATAKAEVVEQMETGLAEKITAPQTAEVGQTIVVKSVDDDGAPKEWGAYTIPQADFLQNDETAADYMKNRTHWTEREKVILSETSLTQDGDVYVTYLEDSIGLVAGNSYTVIYDGEEYTCIGVDLTSFMGTACVGLGNLAEFGIESAEYPFIVLDAPGRIEDGFCAAVRGSGEATVSIVYEGETVHKLDNKYLNLDWLPITEEKGDILPETVVSINTLITGTSNYYLNIDTVISYTAGQKVVVYVNGTRYVCEILEDDGIGYICAGALTMQCWRKYTSVVSSAPGEYTLRICELEANCLPEEYLPAGVPLIQTAKVGQAVVVKTINDEGLPIEWECVDLPFGEPLRLIGSVTTEELVKTVVFTTYPDGTPFAVNHLLFYALIPQVESLGYLDLLGDISNSSTLDQVKLFSVTDAGNTSGLYELVAEVVLYGDDVILPNGMTRKSVYNAFTDIRINGEINNIYSNKFNSDIVYDGSGTIKCLGFRYRNDEGFPVGTRLCIYEIL